MEREFGELSADQHKREADVENLQLKYGDIDYALKRPSEAVQPVKDIARVGGLMTLQRERLVILIQEIERDISQAQDPEGKEKLLMTYLVKVKDFDEEAQFLKEKARC